MKKILISLFLALAPLLAHAQTVQTIHVCKCDNAGEVEGANVLCVAGSDSNDGLTPATPKLSRPSVAIEDALGGGSQILHCRGGYWDAESMHQIENINATAASPITWGAYTAPFGATERPTIRATANNAIWQTGGFFNVVHDGGYVWRDLRLVGNGSNSTGAIFFNKWVYDVTLDNLWIEGWYSGNLWAIEAGQISCARMLVKNSTFYRNGGNGYLGGCSDSTWENNLFQENNFDGSALEHGAYHGGRGIENNVTLRKNRFIDNSLNGSNVCTSGNLTIRGSKTRVLIEENFFKVPSSTELCFGVSINAGYGDWVEYMLNVIVRGNTFVNIGRAIELMITPGVLVENNRIWNDVATTGVFGINFSAPESQEAAYVPINSTVRYNTIYIGSATGSGSQCITYTAGTGGGHRVYGNGCVIGASSAATAFTPPSLGNTTLWNHNCVHLQGSGGWSASLANLAAAQAAGYDANGCSANPLFVSTAAPTGVTGTSLTLPSNSPWRNIGRVPVSPTEPALAYDFLYCKRGAQPDVGAHEYGGAPCVPFRAPVGLR